MVLLNRQFDFSLNHLRQSLKKFIFSFPEVAAETITVVFAVLLTIVITLSQLKTVQQTLGTERPALFDNVYKPVWITLAVGSLISALICVLVWTLKQRLISQRKLVLLQNYQKAFLQKTVEEKTNEILLANKELSDANAELEAFTYSVSHDLRAPLRGIDGFCHILVDEEKGRLTIEGERYLSYIRDGVQRMGALIDDLLNLSRINRAPIELNPIDVSKLCYEIREHFALENSGFNTEFNIQTHMKTRADLGLIRILFSNLINNAVKFSKNTSRSKIDIGLVLNGSNHQVFYVRDNGIGFDMKFANKIFEPFKRLHTEKEFPGTGIGLATCKRVVQRHGGRIWAESVRDHGTVFYFTLSPE